MRQKILASLIYTGRSRDWLARRLGISRRTLERRLSDGRWLQHEVEIMKSIFKWEES